MGDYKANSYLAEMTMKYAFNLARAGNNLSNINPPQIFSGPRLILYENSLFLLGEL